MIRACGRAAGPAAARTRARIRETTMSMEAEVTRNVLMYFVLPLWLFAGFADYLCHRASSIATTAGPRNRSSTCSCSRRWASRSRRPWGPRGERSRHPRHDHLLGAARGDCGVGCILRPRQAGDHSHRAVGAQLPGRASPLEPRAGRRTELGQFLALFGFGTATPRFEIVWREPPLPWGYVLSVITAVMLLEVLPYLEELVRGLIANGGRLVPRPAVRAVRPERS